MGSKVGSALSKEQVLLRRNLPAVGATVADIGGAPGQYSVWLAGEGYRVLHRDLVRLHVEAATMAADREWRSRRG